MSHSNSVSKLAGYKAGHLKFDLQHGQYIILISTSILTVGSIHTLIKLVQWALSPVAQSGQRPKLTIHLNLTVSLGTHETSRPVSLHTFTAEYLRHTDTYIYRVIMHMLKQSFGMP